VKCNPEPVLLRWLSEAGYGFDCASAREIEIVLDSANGKGSQDGKAVNSHFEEVYRPDIIFANPCKKREDIHYAKEVGIQTTVVDSVEEVHKLAACGWKGDSLIRIMVQDSGSKMPFSAKFGCPLAQVEKIHRVAQRVGQTISGVSFHVGSGGGDVSQYYVALIQASHALCKVKKHFRNSRIIDIGGGMTDESFPSISRIVKNSIHMLPSKTVFMAEPGRFMANRSQDLFVKVIGKKPSTKGNGFRYTLDESLYGQFSCIPDRKSVV